MQQLLNLSAGQKEAIAKTKTSAKEDLQTDASGADFQNFLSILISNAKDKSAKKGENILDGEIKDIDLSISTSTEINLSENKEDGTISLDIKEFIEFTAVIKIDVDLKSLKYLSEEKLDSLLNIESLVKEIKEATNLGELLNAAKKGGIEIESFEFENESVLLELGEADFFEKIEKEILKIKGENSDNDEKSNKKIDAGIRSEDLLKLKSSNSANENQINDTAKNEEQSILRDLFSIAKAPAQKSEPVISQAQYEGQDMKIDGKNGESKTSIATGQDGKNGAENLKAGDGAENTENLKVRLATSESAELKADVKGDVKADLKGENSIKDILPKIHNDETSKVLVEKSTDEAPQQNKDGKNLDLKTIINSNSTDNQPQPKEADKPKEVKGATINNNFEAQTQKNIQDKTAIGENLQSNTNDLKNSKTTKEQNILPQIQANQTNSALNEQAKTDEPKTTLSEQAIEQGDEFASSIDGFLKQIKKETQEEQNLAWQTAQEGAAYAQEGKTGENGQNEEQAKNDNQIQKIDSVSKKSDFEVSSKNSDFNPKMTIDDFVAELKEKIENYKPPLTRVSMTLKPESLGEVDVTILSRGNNLTVNINSNQATLSVLTQNQTEFKNSLVSMGFTGLSMSFSSGGDQRNDGRQNNQNKKFNFGEASEEELKTVSSIELTLPRYI